MPSRSCKYPGPPILQPPIPWRQGTDRPTFETTLFTDLSSSSFFFYGAKIREKARYAYSEKTDVEAQEKTVASSL